jgi:hypothetical protein
MNQDSVEVAIVRAEQAEKVFESLIGHEPEADLFASLAAKSEMRTEILRRLDFDSALDLDDLVRGGPIEDLGKRLFGAWNRSLWEFFCGSEQTNADLKNRLFSAITGKGGGSAAIIAGVLVATFHVGAPVAALVASLVCRLILIPAQGEICSAWHASLSNGAPGGAPGSGAS